MAYAMDSDMPVSSKAQEPSIDEILDSIRRIIADEDLAVDMDEEVRGSYVTPSAAALSSQARPSVQAVRRHTEDGPSSAHAARPHVSALERGGRYAPAAVAQVEPVAIEPRYHPVEQAATAMRVVNPPVREPEPRRQSASLQKPARESSPQERYVADARPQARADEMRQANTSFSQHGDDRMDNSVPPLSGQSANVRSRPAAAAPRVSAPQASDMRATLPRRDLLSPAVDAAVSAAFQSLGDLVLPQHERTVEDLVKEILRPMLKEWLDQNLAGIVERLVRAEIERVTGNIR